MGNMGTVEEKHSAIGAEQYRKRIEYEDQLLYTRFNLVLVLNGFATVAVGFNQPIYSKILLAFVMVVINVLGAIAVLKTERVIATLSRHVNDPINDIVQKELGKPGLLRPNQILCRIFPIVLILGWVSGLFLALASLP
jgi:hypothetical protein